MEINKDKPRNQCARKPKTRINKLIPIYQGKKEVVYLIRKGEKVNQYNHTKNELLNGKEAKNIKIKRIIKNVLKLRENVSEIYVYFNSLIF